MAEPDNLGEEAARDLEQIFRAATRWRDRIGGNQAAPPEGSSLRGDDRATDPYQMSHAVHMALLSAVDHVDAVGTMVARAGVLHSHAPFTLLRAAIENAAVAVWLLEPAARSERVLRRLRLQWADFVDGDQASGGNADDLRKNKERLQGLGRTRGLSADEVASIAARTVGYGSIVELAGNANPYMTAEIALLCWRACSGIAHAKPWAMLAILDTEETGQLSHDVHQLRVTASDSNIVTTALTAALMIQRGWELLDERTSVHR